MVKSPKDFINGNWRACVLLMGTGALNDAGQCSRRADGQSISFLPYFLLFFLPLSLFFLLPSFSYSSSLSLLLPCLVVSLFLDGQQARKPLTHMQLPRKCRHPRSCVSPSLTHTISLSLALACFPSMALRLFPSFFLSFCLFFSSWPTDQQTVAHASVVDTILEHWLSACYTCCSRDIRSAIPRWQLRYCIWYK